MCALNSVRLLCIVMMNEYLYVYKKKDSTIYIHLFYEIFCHNFRLKEHLILIIVSTDFRYSCVILDCYLKRCKLILQNYNYTSFCKVCLSIKNSSKGL